MKIRVVKKFNGYRVGQVFDWADGMAKLFVNRGFIVPVEDAPVERAVADEPDVEHAVVDSPVRRKARAKP